MLSALSTIQSRIYYALHTPMSKEDKLDFTRMVIAAVFLGLMAAFLFCNFAFAAGDGTGALPGNAGQDAKNAKLAMWTVISIICQIVRIIGVIFIIVGVVKFVISHANEQGPEQQKAILMLATGVVLVIVPTILIAVGNNLQDVIIQTDVDTTGAGGGTAPSAGGTTGG